MQVPELLSPRYRRYGSASLAEALAAERGAEALPSWLLRLGIVICGESTAVRGCRRRAPPRRRGRPVPGPCWR